MRHSQLARSAMAEIGLDYDGVSNDLRRRALAMMRLSQHKHVPARLITAHDMLDHKYP
jgi:hypothetical protein